MKDTSYKASKAQISRTSIQRLHTSMKHLFMRGGYKPLGVSGETMISAMLALQPEIYGSIADPEKVELNGLLYIFQRLPYGIESCRYVKLIGREGYENADFEALVPSKRRRNCYRIDEEQMYIEMTRGRSDIYDVLTHLTFMYIEAEKIRRNALDHADRPLRAWTMLKKFMEEDVELDVSVGFSYLSALLGRTYEEVEEAYTQFQEARGVSSLFELTYWLGRISIDEHLHDNDREITFSSTLRETLGHHLYGEKWAQDIKQYLEQKNLLSKEIHIISANMHSIMNSIYAHHVVCDVISQCDLVSLAEQLSQDENKALRHEVEEFAATHGMTTLSNNNGTNMDVQIIDGDKLVDLQSVEGMEPLSSLKGKVIVVMDYAFGEQAFESMDELLKPYLKDDTKIPLDIASVNIMGKAGILEGKKGDIMIPTAHIFEGTTDNYPVDNDMPTEGLAGDGVDMYTGPMITVLGTSLQNKDILRYFHRSSWKAIGLEMEGGHYQKAIQAASLIRKNVSQDIKVRYAYYASDNPLETGSTLASGSLGLEGVKPTYRISLAILNAICRS